MNVTIPPDLLKLKIRFEAWRKKRKYVREAIPEELRLAASEMCRRYTHSLIRRVLKIQPNRLNQTPAQSSARTRVRKQPPTAFFELPTGVALPEPVSMSSPERAASCRLEFERPDGAKLAVSFSAKRREKRNNYAWGLGERPAFYSRSFHFFSIKTLRFGE